MKTEVLECDIDNRVHGFGVETMVIKVIFDHDQEDGKLKLEPYLQEVKLEICGRCKKHMLKERKYIYAYGAMGNNKYTL